LAWHATAGRVHRWRLSARAASALSAKNQIQGFPNGTGRLWFVRENLNLIGGRGWISPLQHLPFSDRVIDPPVSIPAASGSYWGPAGATTKVNSSVDHPAITIYGPLP
jgi:hypothetical protein